jgi:hypothetical protein
MISISRKDGRNYGGSNEMESTEIGSSGLLTRERQSPQAGSQKRIKKSSPKGRDADGTPRAEPTPTDCEPELSILQAVYDQALGAGLKAKRIQTDVGGEPVLVLQLYGVRSCGVCGAWTLQDSCPACGPE